MIVRYNGNPRPAFFECTFKYNGLKCENKSCVPDVVHTIRLICYKWYGVNWNTWILEKKEDEKKGTWTTYDMCVDSKYGIICIYRNHSKCQSLETDKKNEERKKNIKLHYLQRAYFFCQTLSIGNLDIIFEVDLFEVAKSLWMARGMANQSENILNQ